jgi:hypothetical protein
MRLAPLLEKWGVEAESIKDEFQDLPTSVERPKIGQTVPDPIWERILFKLNNVKNLLPSRLKELDKRLVEHFRFFSIIDENVRFVIYKSCELVHFKETNTLIEDDVDETKYVYIVLKGKVDYMMFKAET